MTRLLRTVHTSARLCDSAAASTLPIPPAWLKRGVRDFTPKGRPIPIRPARQDRVTLPSGYPEPPSYPPPESYWTELNEIDAKGKPKPHPLWAFFHVPPQMQTRPEGTAAPDNMGSLDLLQDEEDGLRSGEYAVSLRAAGPRCLVWSSERERKVEAARNKNGSEIARLRRKRDSTAWNCLQI